MDRGLAGEAERGGGARLDAEPVRVAEIEPGDVQQVEPVAGGGVDHGRARIEQRFPGLFRAQIGRHVDSAEEQGIDPRRCPGDLLDIGEPVGRFDDHVVADLRAVAVEQRIVERDLLRRAHLRQHQRGRRRGGGAERQDVPQTLFGR